MKKSSIVSAIMLAVTAFMLSGCLFPYWDDDGYGRGGHRGGRGGGEGHREGGRH